MLLLSLHLMVYFHNVLINSCEPIIVENILRHSFNIWPGYSPTIELVAKNKEVKAFKPL